MTVPNSKLVLSPTTTSADSSEIVPSVHASVDAFVQFATTFVPYAECGGPTAVCDLHDRHLEFFRQYLKKQIALTKIEAKLDRFSLSELRAALFMVDRKYHFSGPPPEGLSEEEIEHMRYLVRQIRVKIAKEKLD